MRCIACKQYTLQECEDCDTPLCLTCTCPCSADDDEEEDDDEDDDDGFDDDDSSDDNDDDDC